ncbi:unnamed protein product [Notodromas monacha]|uniref:Uncharacterized protein n=1 Tax=Notodromas monacha TaxID=399045 RepID=A0A7R9BK93_9CRUS|nr:unnamed protein product [Notodromas monacha]CAG0916193.1 unnamed protein product [Notodromas monacha]
MIAGIMRTSLVTRLSLSCALLSCLFCLWMDFRLFLAVQSLKSFPDNSSRPDEAYSPFKHITVKLMWMDPINQYIEKPLAQSFVQGAKLRETLPLLTPNVISCTHVFVAFAAARLTAKRGFQVRYVAGTLMLVRNFLDTVDGALAREISKNHQMTDYGSFGYFFDGVCDTAGIVFFFLGCVMALRVLATKRGALAGSEGRLVFDEMPDVNPHVAEMHRQIWAVMWCYGVQVIVSSVTWNIYMERFHNLLELGSGSQQAKEFVTAVRYWGFALIFGLVLCTEFYLWAAASSATLAEATSS